MKKTLFAVIAIVLCFASCVKDEQYNGITISSVSYSPEAVTNKDDVTVTANITSLKPLTASLIYNVNDGTPVIVDMISIDNGTIFQSVIPAQKENDVVSFYIEAKSTESDVIATTEPKSYTITAFVIDYSQLVFNELNGGSKFIELYNKGTETIDLEGCTMYKDDNDVAVWTVNTDSPISIAPGQFLLLYSLDVQADHADHPGNQFFNSGISAKKSVKFAFKTPAGSDIDVFTRGPEPWSTGITNTGDVSYARIPDGTGDFKLADPTPGTANPTTDLGDIPQE